MFQNDCGIVVGFENVSVLNFDAYLKSDTNYVSRTVKVTGIREVRFLNQLQLPKIILLKCFD
jgi:hypothetical protein